MAESVISLYIGLLEPANYPLSHPTILVDGRDTGDEVQLEILHLVSDLCSYGWHCVMRVIVTQFETISEQSG